MAANFGPKHPRMIDIDSRVNQIEQELTREIQRLKRAIKAELDRALAYEKSIQQTLNAQKHEALSLNEKDIKYDILRQESQSNQQIYDSLLKQAKELGLVSGSEHSNISLVDEAEVPLVPVRPKTFLNILLSIVVSMFMGPFLAFFLEYMDRTIKTPEDVQRRLGLSVLGLVPYDKTAREKKNPVLLKNHTSVNKKKYTNGYPLENISGPLMQNLHVMQQEAYGQVLFIQSATSGEGKTTVLANSALKLARNGIRVLMIDADSFNPSLHNMFNVKNKGGLIDIMAGILSQRLSRGKLETYSVDDLFFLVSLQKLSGTLTITNNSQTTTSQFENGRLLHIQALNGSSSNRLGTMLVRRGLLSESQLGDALSHHELTRQPLGYILINAGYLTQEQLQGPLRLQTEENLQKLFSWKNGTFVFTPESIKPYQDEKIYFGEDYTPIIHRLGRLAGSRFLESEVFSQIHPVYETNVSLLPSGTASIKPHGPVYMTLFAKFLDIVKRYFDIILIDTPPVLEMPDVAPLSSLGEGAVFVVKAGNLSFKITNEAVTALKEANVNILGAVLNQVKLEKKDYFKYLPRLFIEKLCSHG
jgi:Mrp family chromosome partitioning ATPase